MRNFELDFLSQIIVFVLEGKPIYRHLLVQIELMHIQAMCNGSHAPCGPELNVT